MCLSCYRVAALYLIWACIIHKLKLNAIMDLNGGVYIWIYRDWCMWYVVNSINNWVMILSQLWTHWVYECVQLWFVTSLVNITWLNIKYIN